MLDVEYLERRFCEQRKAAKQRGIEWQLTFDQWLSMWSESGQLAKRGCGSGKYVMARRGDVGPYSVENCFICSFEQNVKDAAPACLIRKAAASRGWTYRRAARYASRPYQVVFRRKYVGTYATQAEAEAAYAMAVADWLGGSHGSEETFGVHQLSDAPLV